MCTQIQLATIGRNKKMSRGQTCRKSLFYLEYYTVSAASIFTCSRVVGFFLLWFLLLAACTVGVSAEIQWLHNSWHCQGGPSLQWRHNHRQGQMGRKVFSRKGNTPIVCKLLFSYSFQYKLLPQSFFSAHIHCGWNRKEVRVVIYRLFSHLKRTKATWCGLCADQMWH